MEKIKILVCAHKEDPRTRNGGPFLAVQAGKALHPELDLGYQCDNTGDNISEKNPYWSELTVLYWGWKNLHDVEYCGLNHYRRYFNIDINPDNIDSLIDGYDMIVVKHDTMLSRRERPDNLMRMTSQEDYYIFADTFLSIHPEYEKEFIEYFYSSRASYPYQMFISSKERYDGYCSFMFPVLFEVERRVLQHSYTRQKRTMGYFGEWFLGLFIHCKHLKVRTVEVCDISGLPVKVENPLRSRLMRLYRLALRSAFDATFKVPARIRVPAAVRAGLKNDGISLDSLD